MHVLIINGHSEVLLLVMERVITHVIVPAVELVAAEAVVLYRLRVIIKMGIHLTVEIASLVNTLEI